MYFILAPINGFLMMIYFLLLHTSDFIILAFIVVMAILEWRDKQIDFVDDERRMV